MLYLSLAAGMGDHQQQKIPEKRPGSTGQYSWVIHLFYSNRNATITQSRFCLLIGQVNILSYLIMSYGMSCMWCGITHPIDQQSEVFHRKITDVHICCQTPCLNKDPHIRNHLLLPYSLWLLHRQDSLLKLPENN